MPDTYLNFRIIMSQKMKSKFFKILSVVKNFLYENTPGVSFFAYYRSNQTMQRFIKDIENWRNIRREDKNELCRIIKLDDVKLTEINKQELVRKEVVEGKAKAKLTFISLAVTITFSGATILMQQGPFVIPYFHLTKWLLVLSVVFLIQGGISSLQAMSIPYIYDGIIYKDLSRAYKRGISLAIAKEILLNRYTNIQRSNYLAMAQKSIRNGLIVLAVVVSGAFISLKLNGNASESNSIRIEGLKPSIDTIESVISDQSKTMNSAIDTLNSIVLELKSIGDRLEENTTLQSTELNNIATELKSICSELNSIKSKSNESNDNKR